MKMIVDSSFEGARGMTLNKWILMAFCAMPVIAMAEPRTPIPDRKDAPQPKTRPAWGRWPGGPRDEAAEKADWDATQTFFKEKSPNRWAAFESMGAQVDEEKSAWLRRAMVMRYRMIQDMKKHGDTDGALVHEKKIVLEDKLFGIRKKMIEVGGIASDAAKKFHPELRAAVADLVQNKIEERMATIKSFERFIKAEEQKNQDDIANKDKLIDQRMLEELSNAGLTPEPPRRGDGPGPSRGDGPGPKKSPPPLPRENKE
jgi:hypothetical protein